MTAFVDARSDDLPTDITSSVCVIGAGAAGITLARKLAESIPNVVLVEAGGFRLDGATQNLFAGHQLGLPYFNLLSCRLRYFGGTTNHWSGYCRANDPIDYEGRPELDLPRWPVQHGDLVPFIDAASSALGIETSHFEPGDAIKASGLDADGLAENASPNLLTKVFQFAPNLRLGALNSDEIAQDPNILGINWLNLTHIQLNADGNSVSHLDCKTLNGKDYKIKAKKYVLCCHAIENARLLLSSDDVQKRGIGNDNDLVGRFFMEHPHMWASRFVPTKDFPILYNRRFAGKHNLNANLSFTDEFTRNEGLLQYYCRFNPVYYPEDTAEAIQHVRADAMSPGDLEFLGDLAEVLGNLQGVGKAGFLRFGIDAGQPMYFDLEHRIEQAPNPLSRVVLSNRLDGLGSRIADLDWQLSDTDIEAFRRGQELIGRELSALGWGRLIEEEITRDLVEQRVKGHYHQIGTTRMSTEASDGVVDANCKVHGLDNLYIGGSSVFPTAGYSGPTMMIMALALRMAEHIEGELK